MSNRMKLNKTNSKKTVAETDAKEVGNEKSKANNFLSAKKSKGNKPTSFTGKSSKAFSKKKT